MERGKGIKKTLRRTLQSGEMVHPFELSCQGYPVKSNSHNQIRAMRLSHRPDYLLERYRAARPVRLRTTNIIVVFIEQGLQADRQSALCRSQCVVSAGSNVVDAGHAINHLTTQKRICFCDDRSDACIRTVGNIQLGSQQVARQTTNGIIRLGAAAVHLVEYCGHFCERVHTVIAKRDG